MMIFIICGQQKQQVDMRVVNELCLTYNNSSEVCVHVGQGS